MGGANIWGIARLNKGLHTLHWYVMTLQLKRRVGYISVGLWMVVIFVFSNQDSSTSSRQSGTIVDFIESLGSSLGEDLLTFLTRKAAHIFVYFVLGILVYNLLRTYNMSRRRMVLVSILIALGYASFDEIHQLFIPGRSGELRDVLIDTAAATIGVLGYALVDKLRNSKNHENTV